MPELEKTAQEPLYFGSRKVERFEIHDNLVYVMFEGGSHEAMTKEEFKKCTAEPTEEKFEWEKSRLEPVVQEVLNVLKNHNIRCEDLSYVFTMVRDSIQMAVNQAKEVAFGQPAWTLRLGDIQNVLDKGKLEGKDAKFTTVLRKVQGGALDV